MKMPVPRQLGGHEGKQESELVFVSARTCRKDPDSASNAEPFNDTVTCTSGTSSQPSTTRAFQKQVVNSSVGDRSNG